MSAAKKAESTTQESDRTNVTEDTHAVMAIVGQPFPVRMTTSAEARVRVGEFQTTLLRKYFYPPCLRERLQFPCQFPFQPLEELGVVARIEMYAQILIEQNLCQKSSIRRVAYRARNVFTGKTIDARWDSLI